MYQLSTDPKYKMVLLKLAGMLTPAEMESMYREEYAAIAAMGCAIGEHVVLADLTECNVQLQDVSAALQAVVSKHGKAKRVAMVMERPLAKLQARRIAESQEARIFTSRDEALAWLREVSPGVRDDVQEMNRAR